MIQIQIIQTIEEQLTFIYKMNFVVLLWINMLVLQFIINFIQSGYFSIKEKIINVIKNTILLFAGLIAFFLLLSVIINFFEQYEYVSFAFALFKAHNLMYAFIYIGVAIVKIPKKSYLLSNVDTSLDYFQFKAYKTHLRIKDNNEKVLEYLHQCKLTMEFIREKEEIGNYSNVEEIETE